MTRATAVEVKGGVVEAEEAPATDAERTSVPVATVDTLLLAANADRRGGTIYNNSSSTLYLGYGATPVTLANFSYKVPAFQGWGIAVNEKQEIRGIWDAADAGGAAKITENT